MNADEKTSVLEALEAIEKLPGVLAGSLDPAPNERPAPIVVQVD
jgi:hypothetical protein